MATAKKTEVKTEIESELVNDRPVVIKPINDPNELVRVYIPRVSGEEESYWCAVNGRKFLIRRGEDVMVPRYVANMIKDNNYAEDVRITKIREAEERFKGNK